MKKILAKLYWLLPLLLLLLVEGLFTIAFKHRGFLAIRPFLLSCLLFYMIFLTLLGLTKRSGASFLTMSIFFSILIIISVIKIRFMDEPLLFADILYLGNTGEIGSIISDGFFVTIKPIILWICLYLVLIIILNIIAIKFSRKIETFKTRLIIAIPSVIILLLLFLPIRPINTFILNNIFDADKRVDAECIVSLRGYFIKKGNIAGMYAIALENRNTIPDNYSEEKIEKALNSISTEQNKSLGKPNIVVIFSESFWDIDQLDEIEFKEPVTPNFNKLKEEGLFFNMISPSYGGLSANVEFEFLTGATLDYFTPGYTPYMQLYTNDSFYNKPSIIQELKNNNYITKISASGSPRLFNCAIVYKYLKVDEVRHFEKVDKQYQKGAYMSDEYVTDLAIEQLENKKDKPLFYMALTMQAHMPYNKDRYEEYDVEITKSPLNEKLNQVIKNYSQGVYDADKQLGRLYEYIKKYKEPTVLIFYGDHLPYLESGKENAMDQLEYFNTEDEKTNIFRKYNTQALVLANFDIKDLKKSQPAYLSPDLLSTYVLNNMDIKLSPYYRWLYTTKETIGASNVYISADQEGNLYYNNELKDEKRELYDLRKMIQYKYFIK